MKNLRAKVAQSRVRISLGLLVMLVFLAHASGWWRLGFLDRLENDAFDQRLRLTMPGTRDDRIVIVDIDEKSLIAEGRWPWSRDKLAALVQRAFDDYGARVLGFDIVFAEADTSSGIGVLDSLAQGKLRHDAAFRSAVDELRPSLNYDEVFAATIARYPVVLGYYFNFPSGSETPSAKIGALPEPTLGLASFMETNVVFRQADGFGANLGTLQSRAKGAGHFNPVPDSDGIVRRIPMLVEYDGAYYGSLALEMVRQLQPESTEVTPLFGESLGDEESYPGLEWLQVGDSLVPVDRVVQSLVPYRGYQGSFKYVSATDLLQGRLDKHALKDAIVLVGTTAPGLLDLRATPVGEAYPGVEVHANLISGMLDGTLKQFPEYTLGAELLMLLVLGLVMAVVAPLLTPLPTTLLAILLLGAHTALNLWTWTSVGFALPYASGALMLVTMFVLNMSYGYFIETRGKRQLTGLFGQYVPPELVSEMAQRPDAYSLAAENRELSVLFSDVRGFTTISEGLDPQALSDLMNSFLTPMTRVIHERRGTIDKYMGDAIMAFWGAPIPDPAHASHAVRAAMEMVGRLDEVNQAFSAKGWPSIKIGVGINTGPMSVGNMGSEFRVAYTVMGDAVNLGSRLESLTKGYGVLVLVSETTRAAAPDYAYREVDRVRVKGKDVPIGIFEPIGLQGELDAEWQQELLLHSEALRAYRAQDWDTAERRFLELAASSRSPTLYRVYAERIGKLRTQLLGPEWDGVHTFTEK